MRRLLEAIGSPQEGLRTIHVAGTKGKGSTVAFLESILMQSGYKVGAYTSPSVKSSGEMFRVGGQEATEQELDRLLMGFKEQVEATEGLRPTYFEVMTAMAYVVIGIGHGFRALIMLSAVAAGDMYSLIGRITKHL
jgi:dihydrofolate synthase / folylpolyglutamate synthase